MWTFEISGSTALLTQQVFISQQPTTSLAQRWGVLLETDRPGFDCRFGFGSFSRLQATSKLVLQAPGVIGSALCLVGPVSVYCDWVR